MHRLAAESTVELVGWHVELRAARGTLCASDADTHRREPTGPNTHSQRSKAGRLFFAVDFDEMERT
eukprot:2104041-Rhodomonas_salina.2